MAHPEATMDFLDGSDDEDNVDQDVENVLLGSDDDESHSSSQQPLGRSSGFSRSGVRMEDRNHHSEEEEDVLNLVLQGDEELLDYDDGPVHDGKQRVPPVKVRNSVMNSGRESSQENVAENLPSGSNYEANAETNDESYSDRRYEENDEYDDADDESETRNTRSRFTSERSVESFNHGGQGGSSSSSVGIPIQTVGERKIRPGVPEGRPKHWNHSNGPRQGGPRHPGRNHRFPNPRLGPPMQNENSRMSMNNAPIVQFNEGIFTDFNQPLRPPFQRPRQPPPGGRFEPPRNMDQNMHRPPMPPPNNVRPNFPHQQQQMRPFFPSQENQGGHPRVPMPGNMPPQQQPPPHRPDFNLRGPRPPRFPPNNMNQRPRPPQHMNNPHHMPHHERPPFPPRPHRPPFRHDFPPHEPMGMNARPPNSQGFPPPPHHAQSGFMPQQMQPNMNSPVRFMGPHGAPHQDQNNPFFQGPPGPGHFHQGPEQVHFQPDGSWNGPQEPMGPNNPTHSPWMQQQQQPPQNFGYPPNPMYEQQPQRPGNPMMVHPNIIGQTQLPLTLQPVQHLEVAQQIPTSIYIKPNSEIHEALSKGHFRPHLKDDDRRHESSSSSHSRQSHYDDHYHDRERSSSSRRAGSPSERRRDDDDYYDDKRYHRHRDYDRTSRRKYSDERRGRSNSPDKKISRSERSSESHSNDHERHRVKEPENKDVEKLLEQAKQIGLGEDYVKKLEEQRKLRERILKTKEQRRKQVKVAGNNETDSQNEKGKDNSQLLKETNPEKRTLVANASRSVHASNSNLQKGTGEKVKEIEADSTVASGKAGKPKKILRIVRDKSGKIISKKVHVVLVAKPQQEGQQSTASA